RTPVSLERIGLELESGLEQDTCYVCDVDSGKTIDPLLSFGSADKHYIGTGPNVLGWGLAAAFGAKLARPDVPVVSVVGDGSFCFSCPQPLWTQSRYKAPIINIVLNNHSYNNELAVCHNLERVTVVKRQKRDWETVVANMYERLGMSAPDEVQAISAYLVAQ